MLTQGDHHGVPIKDYAATPIRTKELMSFLDY